MPANRSGGGTKDGHASSDESLSTSGRHGGAAAAPNAGGRTAVATDSSSNNDVARAISEADIIQLQGDTLYALSRVAGLAIIDVKNPDALKLLGRYRELPAQPFELYLRDNVALVMFSGWGQYEKADDGGYRWVSTSKLLALDVADPAHVASIGSFDIPGTISDSRIVGDILYVVGHEDGYCYGCDQNNPRTSVVSLSVADPHAVKKVDELFYSDGNNNYSSQKSITVTDKRMYIAGPEYGADKPTGSTIQVVDISRPDGDMVEAAKVQVAGEISSRWQMDEYQGVLRVISQPLQWWTPQGQQFSVPSVQTFKVESSTQISPLGQTEIKLPMRETLRSARFDGPRAYAITAEQKDPLFTIDLSDPAKPRQVGELMLPGFVWHLEPRGERLLGLGFDQGNSTGGLTVSLFDVKNLAAPKLLSRANFGGTWAYLPEDQDRAQKLFRVLDDAGLIFVPFSGWNDGRGVDNNCGGSYVGGVEIVDFQNDTLKARGAAGVTGQARRALWHKERLLTVSDERVQSYDIADRDAPKQTSAVVMSRQVYQAFQLDNDIVARVSMDSNNGQPSVDFVAASAAEDPNQSLSELNLGDVGGDASAGACSKSFGIERVFAQGSQLDVLYTSYSNNATGTSERGVMVIDASKPEHPVVVSDTRWPNDQNWYTYSGFYNYGYYNATESILRTKHSLSMLESTWVSTPVSSMQKVRLRVVDLRDPAHVSTKVLPFDTVASYSGLIADGDAVLTSHLISTPNDTSKARFYVDRIDVSDPTAPRLVSSINVPGALLHYDSANKRALTSDQVRIVVHDLTSEACYERFAYAEWQSPNDGRNAVSGSGTASVGVRAPQGAPSAGTTPASDTVAPPPPPPPTGECNGFRQRLHLVHMGATTATLDDTIVLDEKQQVASSSMGNGVVFATIGQGSYYRGGGLATLDVACFGPCFGGGATPEPAELLVLSGFASGHFEEGRIRVDDANSVNPWWGFWGTPPVYAYDKHALLLGQSDIAIIDGSDAKAPTLKKRVPLIAGATYVDIREHTALLTLQGAQGVQWLTLD